MLFNQPTHIAMQNTAGTYLTNSTALPAANQKSSELLIIHNNQTDSTLKMWVTPTELKAIKNDPFLARVYIKNELRRRNNI